LISPYQSLYQQLVADKDMQTSLRFNAEQSLKEKKQFIAFLSHELRTPLNAIVSFAGLAKVTNSEMMATINLNKNVCKMRQDICAKGAALNKHLSIIEKADQYILRIVEDILELSRIEAGRWNLFDEEFDLDELIEDTLFMVSEFARIKNIDLRLKIAHSVPDKLSGDCHHLQSILVNLITNALKFTDEGYVELAIKAVAINGKSCRLNFTVTDSGIGIEESVLEKLFEPFSSFNIEKSHIYGGSGLGLAIAKQTTELMGGSISVTKNQSAGSRFCLELPFQLAGETMPMSRNNDEPAAIDSYAPILKGKRILLIEDSVFNQQVIKLIGDRTGIILDIADNGATGLAIIQHNHYDLILLDMILPDIAGWDLCRMLKLQSDYKGVPVIALTGLGLQEAEEKCHQAGMNDFILKPVDILELLRKIADNLAKTDKRQLSVSSAAVTGYCESGYPLHKITSINLAKGLKMVYGDQGMLEKLLRSFYEHYANHGVQIQQAIDIADWNKAERLIHTLKNVAGMLAAENLFKCSNRLQVSIMNCDEVQCREEVRVLKRTMDKFLDEIRDLVVNCQGGERSDQSVGGGGRKNN
jgi:signal transduction histidine kinase/HPt (histidine-containing phosphotransfer) domain-containing protein/ActR/RegA family two-component response regulator